MKVLRIHTLEKGWCDKDHLMLHAAFQLLVDFVEKEKPEEIVDWSHDPEHEHAWKEIRALYEWWTRTRPARVDPLLKKGLKSPPMRWKKVPGTDYRQLVKYDKKKYPDYVEAMELSWRLEKEWEEEDQRNFHRLVDIRGYLWV